MPRSVLVSILPFFVALCSCSGADFTLPASPDLADGSTADGGDDASGADANGPDAIGPDAMPDGTAPDGATDGPVVDAEVPCTKNDECKPGVCVRRGCSGGSPGTCAPLVGAAQFGPVCGCDGVTYWNATIAATREAPISHDEPCIDGEANTCLGETCDSGSGSGGTCVHALLNESACLAGTVRGTCWLVPAGATCGASPGPSVRTCSDKCATECAAIQAKTSYYHVACTPG